MNATTTEPIDRPNIEEHARIIGVMLKEYADKLAALNADLLTALDDSPHMSMAKRAAWLLDQGELLRKPLSLIISRGSGLLEHSPLEIILKDVLALRMREIEIHLHHMLRLTHELRKAVEDDKKLGEQVAKLRYAAGLNAMKGGPLRPDEVRVTS